MIAQQELVIVAEEEQEDEEEEDGAETEQWEREKAVRKRHKPGPERKDTDPRQQPWWKIW